MNFVLRKGEAEKLDFHEGHEGNEGREAGVRAAGAMAVPADPRLGELIRLSKNCGRGEGTLKAAGRRFYLESDDEHCVRARWLCPFFAPLARE